MTNNKYESAKQYIENCKRMGKQERREPEKARDTLYKRHGCQIYIDDKIDPLLDELNKFHENLNKAGFYTKWPSNGACLSSLVSHVDIPRKIDFSKEKSAKQKLDDAIDAKLNSFGKQHGFPVYFVTTNTEVKPVLVIDGEVVKDGFLHLFRKDEKHKASAFARNNNGLLGKYDPVGDSVEK